MLLVPTWDKHIVGDTMLRQLVDALLAAVGPLALRPDADVRPALPSIEEALAASAQNFELSPVAGAAARG